MCQFVLNVCDVENLDSNKKRELTDYLERRKQELETKLSSVNRALDAVKGRGNPAPA
jgi:hypothetical protein